ncbi:MAG: hypothetical protein JOY96_07665 [Verrucomicrobia bacterium]|nr:hypothetical protein [Verrucomicrobiota bacterium]MBV9673101.1 hypothetical protein [Verrucomicrobiota bacterium]
MKRLLLKNWRAKLMSLVVAIAVWYVIKRDVEVTPEPWRGEKNAAQQSRE